MTEDVGVVGVGVGVCNVDVNVELEDLLGDVGILRSAERRLLYFSIKEEVDGMELYSEVGRL